MSAVNPWVLIGLCAAVTVAIKAAGPVALGQRELPAWFTDVIARMAPALLAALVCTAALAHGHRLGVGAQTAGVAVAGVALWRGANVILAVAIAVAVTAGLRALGA